MNAARSGIVAQFVTAYLQREIPMKAIVTGGTDAGLRDGLQLGFAPGRLVKITNVNGVNTVAPATGVTSKSIGDATHIIAQSDDTVRDVPQDFNYTERYNYVPNFVYHYILYILLYFLHYLIFHIYYLQFLNIGFLNFYQSKIHPHL